MSGELSKFVGRVRRFALPTPVDPIQSRRVELSRRLYARFSGQVAYGPFRGLKLAPDAHWGSSVHSHQLLGIYEQELLNAIFDLPETHRTFVDIGSQDGYYAVGAVRAGLFDIAHCFEILQEGRELIAENARRNGLKDKVHIYGAADATLAETLAAAGVDVARSVVLCDIEGGEFDVFDRAMFETLKGAIIFIELHPFAVDGGRGKIATLKEAAAANFNITELTTGARDLSAYPELDSYSDTDRWLLCSEGRPERMSWLRLDAQAQPSPGFWIPTDD